MRNPIAYIASPLGFSEVGRLFYNNVLIPMIKEIGFEVRDPWVLTPQETIYSAAKLPYGQEKKERWHEVNHVIGRNNERGIEESDTVIAVLDGVDVDSGTASEIGFGVALGKTAFGYRGDFRLSSDNEGSTVNLQVEYFIHRSGGKIVISLELLKMVLTEYRNQFISKYRRQFIS